MTCHVRCPKPPPSGIAAPPESLERPRADTSVRPSKRKGFLNRVPSRAQVSSADRTQDKVKLGAQMVNRPLVYVCYSYRDGMSPLVRRLLALLHETDGVGLWEPIREDPDTTTEQWLYEAIHDADVFLLALTSRSFRDSSVRIEFNMARSLFQDNEKPKIIVVKLEARKVPKSVACEQIVDLSEDCEHGMSHLLQQLTHPSPRR